MSIDSYKINKGITFNPQAAVPSSPTNGDVYFDANFGTYALYQNGFWVNLASTADVASAASLTSTQFTTTVVQNSLVRVTGSTASSLHGLAASTSAKMVIVYNQGSNTLTLVNQSVTEPTAANRISTPGGNSIIIASGQVVKLIYDSVAASWAVSGSVGALILTVATDSATTGSDATLASFTASIIRLTNISLVSLGGIPAGSSGQQVIIENQTGNDITIKDNDLGVTAANRLRTGAGGDTIMQNNATFVFFYDSTANFWMLVSGSVPTATAIPTGAMMDFSGFAAPSGWLLCNNAQVSRVTYAALFAALTIQQTGTTSNGSPIITNLADTSDMAIGMPISGLNVPLGSTILSIDSGTQIHINNNCTGSGSGIALVIAPWGVGDGSTTFNVPDFKGRASVGAGTGSGLTARYMGDKSGEETHLLTTGEMPSHTHVQNPHTHTSSIGVGSPSVGNNNYERSNSSNANLTSISSTTAVNQSTGGGGAHNNMQPFSVANKIIKT